MGNIVAGSLLCRHKVTRFPRTKTESGLRWSTRSSLSISLCQSLIRLLSWRRGTLGINHPNLGRINQAMSEYGQGVSAHLLCGDDMARQRNHAQGRGQPEYLQYGPSGPNTSVIPSYPRLIPYPTQTYLHTRFSSRHNTNGNKLVWEGETKIWRKFHPAKEKICSIWARGL